ncbi:MAG: PAS domain S-box protein [Promethearchaeota archaeon]
MSDVKNKESASDDRFKIIFKNIPIPSYIWQINQNDLILIDFNFAAEEITNNQIKNYLGVKASELYKKKPKIFEDLQRCAKGQINFSKEMKYHMKSTDIEKIFDVKFVFVQPDLVLVHTKDITERKQTKVKLNESEENLKKLNQELEQMVEVRTQKLKESEEKFRRITEQSILGICIMQDDVIKYSNQKLADIFGLQMQEILNLKPGEFINTIAPEYREFVMEQARKKQEGDKDTITQYTYKGIKKSGEEIWIENYSKTIEYERRLADLITLIEITDKIKAEKKLKESEEKYRLLFENMNDLVVVHNDKFEFEYINESVFMSVLGYSKADLIGKTNAEIIHPNDLKGAVLAASKILRKGTGSYQARYLHKNGSIKWFDTTGGIFINSKGEKKIIRIMRDITERKQAELKLIQEKKFSESLINSSVDGILAYDLECHYTIWNPGMERISGVKKEDALGKCAFEVFPFLKDIGEDKFFNDALNGKHVIAKDRPYKVPESGNTGFFEGYYSPLYDETGKIVGGVTIIRDISDRKNSEHKLKEHARQIEFLNQIIIAGNKSKSLSLLLENVLSSTMDFMNFEAGGIYLINEPKKIAELVFHKGLSSDFIEKAKQIKIDVSPFNTVFIDGKSTFEDDYSRFRPVQSEKTGFLSSASIPLFSKGKIIGALNIASKNCHFFSDIEKDTLKSLGREIGTIITRMMAEKKLNESEKRYRHLANELEMILDNIPSLVFSKDTENNFIRVNKYFADAQNLRKEDMEGLSCFDIYPKEQAQAYWDDDLEIINSRQPKLNIVELRKSEKGKRWVNTSKIPYIGEDGNVKGIIGIATDITEIKLAEEKLKEINKLKSELMTRTSHELKTPLVSIKGFADLLLNIYNDKLDNDVISIVENIKMGCERLEGLIKDLLKSSHLESGQMQLNLSREDLSFLIKFCVNELERLVKARNQKIKLKIQENLITNFEKERIYEVISNLITNAMKNSPPDQEITIQTEIKDHFYIVSVKDNGIGFTEDEKEKIFTQFGKVERYGQGYDLEIEGTGLGLYISKKIIELHGGEIWMESEGRNKGSTFYFSLPVIKS